MRRSGKCVGHGSLGAWEHGSVGGGTVQSPMSKVQRGKFRNPKPRPKVTVIPGPFNHVMPSFRTSCRGRDEPESSGTIIINTTGLRVLARSDPSSLPASPRQANANRLRSPDSGIQGPAGPGVTRHRPSVSSGLRRGRQIRRDSLIRIHIEYFQERVP